MKRANSIFFVVFTVHFIGLTYSQTIPTERLVDWSKAGLNKPKPKYLNTIYLNDFGADTTGNFPCDQSMSIAIMSANKQSASIILGNGTYLFKEPISLVDSILIQGIGYQNTHIIFDLDQNLEQDGFQIYGEWTNDIFQVKDDVKFNDSTIICQGEFEPGGLIYLQFQDSSLVNDSWAMGHVSQLCDIKSIDNDTLTIDGKIRRNYLVSEIASVRKINPIEWCGITCLSIERKENAPGISSNIGFQYARNCFVESVYSHFCNFGHVRSDVCSHIEISDSYFHEANDYGGGGKGYGVVFMTGSGECKAENNIFRRLRHSMLLQSGANGNVYAYNYSTDPFWTGTSFPSNSAGDIVCHGNWPFANLFEGNVAQNLVIDDSHKDNGPFNTFLRNRLESYGILMNNAPPSNSQNFIGNEVTTTLPFFGYILSGSNHYNYGNNIKGICNPSGTENVTLESLYLTEAPTFFKSKLLPIIGYPVTYNSKSNPAQERYLNGQLIEGCGISTAFQEPQIMDNLSIYPNPSNGIIQIGLHDNSYTYTIEISSINGSRFLSQSICHNQEIDISQFPAGILLIKLTNTQTGSVHNQMIIKSI